MYIVSSKVMATSKAIGHVRTYIHVISQYTQYSCSTGSNIGSTRSQSRSSEMPRAAAGSLASTAASAYAAARWCAVWTPPTTSGSADGVEAPQHPDRHGASA